jgi:hypothetical protein
LTILAERASGLADITSLRYSYGKVHPCSAREGMEEGEEERDGYARGWEGREGKGADLRIRWPYK